LEKHKILIDMKNVLAKNTII